MSAEDREPFPEGEYLSLLDLMEETLGDQDSLMAPTFDRLARFLHLSRRLLAERTERPRITLLNPRTSANPPTP